MYHFHLTIYNLCYFKEALAIFFHDPNVFVFVIDCKN